MCLPDVAANNAVVSNGDASENRRVAIHRDIVLKDRMSWYIERIAVSVELKAFAAERDTLV